jgi:hypothetical protein
MSDNRWRPIAEAPKDGTKVDLWMEISPRSDGWGDSYRVTDAWWSESKKRWMYSQGNETFTLFHEYAIHWRFPPAPPTVAGSACLNEPPRSREAAALDVVKGTLLAIMNDQDRWHSTLDIYSCAAKALTDIETILEGDKE